MDKNSSEADKEQDSDNNGVSKSRGPAYPYVDLPGALKRLDQIIGAGLSTKQTVAPEAMYGFWQMGVKSSSARQTLAALKYFGLVEYVGTGRERRVKLTDRAMILAHDKSPTSARRISALREAALLPDIFGEIYSEKGGPFLPPRESLILDFTLEKGFDKESAEKAVDNFLASVQLAGLDRPTSEASSSPTVEAEDERVQGSSIPKAAPRQESARSASPLLDAREGYKDDTYATADGDVTLRWPIALSSDSLEELEEWTQLILRKIKREIQRRERGQAAASSSDSVE